MILILAPGNKKHIIILRSPLSYTNDPQILYGCQRVSPPVLIGMNAERAFGVLPRS